MPKYRDPETGFEAEAASPEAFGRLLDARLGPAAEGPPPMTIRVGGAREPEGPPIPTPRDYARERGKEAGAGQAGLLGFGAGVTRQWQDELAGLGAASGLPVGTPPLISGPVGGIRMLAGDKEARDAYERQIEQMRGFAEGAQEAHPYASLGGEVAGGMLGPIQAPGVVAGIGRGLTEGAITGAGAAEGDRASGAGLGTAVGGVIGGVVPAVGGAVGRAGRGLLGLSAPTAAQRGAVEGERQLAEALARDADRSDPLIRDYLENFAQRSGQEPAQVLGDAGPATRDVVRGAANLSPEAWDTVASAANERFRGQQDRFQQFWGSQNSLQTRDELRAAARAANEPRYRAAYAQGEQGVWTPELQTLTTSDAVQRAIREATNIGRDEAARRGVRVPRNPFVEQEGVMTLPEGARPTLEFWDHVQRALREQAEAQPRGGAAATRIGDLRRQLNERLDVAVPAFGEARRGALAAFNAEDALEAGRGFLARPSKNLAEEKRALGRMNPAERDLFRTGLEESVLETVRSRGTNRNISELLNSPELQDRLRMGLGPQRSQDFNNFMRVEGTMDRLRTALGNSTTVRQRETVEMLKQGLIGGAGAGAAGTGFGIENTPTTLGGIGGVVAAALMRGNQQLTRAAATRIAQLAVSRDPQDMEALLRTARRNPVIGRAVRDGFTALENTLIQQGAAFAGEEFD